MTLEQVAQGLLGQGIILTVASVAAYWAIDAWVYPRDRDRRLKWRIVVPAGAIGFLSLLAAVWTGAAAGVFL